MVISKRERIGTACPLLKCLRTHYGRCCEPFFGKNALDLQDFAYTISNFFSRDHTPWSPQKRPRCLDPDINFRSTRQRSHCFCFTKRPLLWTGVTWNLYADSKHVRNYPSFSFADYYPVWSTIMRLGRHLAIWQSYWRRCRDRVSHVAVVRKCDSAISGHCRHQHHYQHDQGPHVDFTQWRSRDRYRQQHSSSVVVGNLRHDLHWVTSDSEIELRSQT